MNADDTDESRQRMGARLRESREYLGFSQEEVAAVLGLSRPAITNIESGQRKVEALELGKLAKLYGRTVSFLLSGSEERQDEERKIAFAARALKGLSDRDIQEVARFADYLRNSAKSRERKGTR